MKVLFVNYYNYPAGDAGSLRIRALMELFRDAGFRCHVLCMGRPDGQDEGVTSLRRGKGSRVDHLADRLTYGSRLRAHLRRHGGQYTHLVFSDLPFWSMVYLKRFSRRECKVLIHDSVEWYSPQQFRLGRLDWNYIAKDVLNRWLIRPPVKVIAISTYLQHHFDGKGCRAVLIPAVLSLDDYPIEKRVDPNCLAILYAGSPGRKDSLTRILGGWLGLSMEERSQTTLRILGLSEAQVKARVADRTIPSLCEVGIVALGRVEHSVVLEELTHADYTVLVRETEQRYAAAGFPTKVVESLASATPVICNRSSDIFDYLEDGVNSIEVKSKQASDVTIALRRAISQSAAARACMSRQARLCAERCFSPSLYRDDLARLLSEECEYPQANNGEFRSQ